MTLPPGAPAQLRRHRPQGAGAGTQHRIGFRLYVPVVFNRVAYCLVFSVLLAHFSMNASSGGQSLESGKVWWMPLVALVPGRLFGPCPHQPLYICMLTL